MNRIDDVYIYLIGTEAPFTDLSPSIRGVSRLRSKIMADTRMSSKYGIPAGNIVSLTDENCPLGGVCADGAVKIANLSASLKGSCPEVRHYYNSLNR